MRECPQQYHDIAVIDCAIAFGDHRANPPGNHRGFLGPCFTAAPSGRLLHPHLDPGLPSFAAQTTQFAVFYRICAAGFLFANRHRHQLQEKIVERRHQLAM